jgi:hypothetical protein
MYPREHAPHVLHLNNEKSDRPDKRVYVNLSTKPTSHLVRVSAFTFSRSQAPTPGKKPGNDETDQHDQEGTTFRIAREHYAGSKRWGRTADEDEPTHQPTTYEGEEFYEFPEPRGLTVVDKSGNVVCNENMTLAHILSCM